MTKTIAITTIALVAVVMGMSAIVPALPQAMASHPEGPLDFKCPRDNPQYEWFHLPTATPGVHPDNNHNGFVCVNFYGSGLTIDDRPFKQLRGIR